MATRPRTAKITRERGLALILVLFIVVMFLLIAGAVLSNSSFTANDTLSVQTKNQTFDAAEAGLNVAQWNIDQNQSAASGTTGSGTVNGYTYNWSIVSNQMHGAGATVSDPNPEQSNTITVPAGQALLAGSASSVLGGRTVYVEEMVVPAPPIYLPDGAITCGGTAQISHQQITDTSGNNKANIMCGTITSSGGGQVPDGDSYSTSSSNAITGVDGIAHVDATPPTFLTAAQLASVQSSALSQAESGGSNYYNSGSVSSGTIGTSGANCVAYIAGNLTMSGSGSLINYCAITVVMGNVDIGGNADYQALPVSTAHIMYVFGTGGVTLHGTPTTVGVIYAANSSVTIDGGGHGNFNGSIITPDSVTMNGGGSASFDYNSTQTPPPLPNPNVLPESQWEY